MCAECALCLCVRAHTCVQVCAPNGQRCVGRGKRGTCFCHSNCSVTQWQPQPPLLPAALPFLSLLSCPVQSREKSPFPLLLPKPGSPCGQLLPTVWESLIFKRHPPCCISLPCAAPRCWPSSYASVCAASAPRLSGGRSQSPRQQDPRVASFSGGRKGCETPQLRDPPTGRGCWYCRELGLGMDTGNAAGAGPPQGTEVCVWGHTRERTCWSVHLIHGQLSQLLSSHFSPGRHESS